MRYIVRTVTQVENESQFQNILRIIFVPHVCYAIV
jgi:hypothetical protein